MKTTKKLWSMVLCICLCLTMLCTMPAAAQQFGEEVLGKGHGSFDGVVPSGGKIGVWQITSGTAAAEQHDPDDTSEKPDSYLKLTATADADVTAKYSDTYLNGKILPGQTYMLSFEYQSDTANMGTVVIREYTADGYTSDYVEFKLPSTDGAWKKTAFLFAPKRSDVYSAVITLNCKKSYVESSATDAVCFDNLSLCTVDTADADVVTRLAVGTATAEGYAADADGNVLLQLFPLGWTAEDKAAVTGYVKAPVGETVTVSASADIASGDLSKTFTGTGDWISFAFEDVAYGKNITVAATGVDVEIKDVSIEKYTNLLADTSTFESWYYSAPDESTLLETDGNCPVGTNYLHIINSSSGRYISKTQAFTPQEGDRYLFSVWYKSDIPGGVIIQHKGADKAEIKAISPQVEFPVSSTWRRAEFIFEVTTSAKDAGGTDVTITRIDVLLGTPQNRYGAGNIYFCAPRLEKLDTAKRNGFYAPCGTIMTRLESEVVLDESLSTRMQILGEPIKSAAGLDEVKAVYIDGATASTGNVVIAAYTKDANNAKQLLGISISEALPATGVAYPTATLDVSNLEEGTEIRAFLWDGISGLKPLEKAITTTK